LGGFWFKNECPAHFGRLERPGVGIDANGELDLDAGDRHAAADLAELGRNLSDAERDCGDSRTAEQPYQTPQVVLLAGSDGPFAAEA
jgi:hypothetical protein